MKKIACLFLVCVSAVMAVAQGYRNDFISPTDGQRSLIIWQWMDGLVSKEAITKDLEAFKADVPDGQYYVYLHFAEWNTRVRNEALAYA